MMMMTIIYRIISHYDTIYLCYHDYYATSYYFIISYIYYYSEERKEEIQILSSYITLPLLLDGVYELEKKHGKEKYIP